MPLSPGTRVGSYEITDQIGIGGMGEVYRAKDVHLGRDVAIKVLPEAFAQDAERLARFEREAKTLASLSHPNIAIVYGFEKGPAAAFVGDAAMASREAGHHVRALVMELVEGPTLADRIAQGPIPIDEALPIAKQIAEALEAAHEQGIIHRDLKPANIKVRDDGTVKVLDFGLAKLIESGSGIRDSGFDRTMSPTITTPAMTQLGVILGTAAYMAPEQARGKPVDKRSDIWAFGCVLFEMLTGTRAFDGEDATDTIAAVVRAEPKWDALPAAVSSPIRLLLRRCLEKERKKRIGDISAALFIIDEHASFGGASSASDAAASRATWKYVAWSVLAVVASGALGALGFVMLTRPNPGRVSRLEVNTSGTSRLALGNGNFEFAITGDGSRIVYMGGGVGGPPNIFSRRLDQLESTMLAERGNYPFVSPDGQWVGFGLGSAIRKVAVTGGASLEVVPLKGGFRGATWSGNDAIVFATTDNETGLLRVPSAGGEPTVLTRPDKAKGEGDHLMPHWLAAANAVLFTVTSAGTLESASSQIAVLPLGSPGAKPKIVLRGGSDARYVPTGHLVYFSGDSLWAVPFDIDRLEVTASAPIRVVASVGSAADVVGLFDIAHDGTLVYLPSASLTSPERQLVWVDRSGKEEVIAAPPKPYVYPRISPDGLRVAIDIREQEDDIWIWDLVRKGFTRVTKDPGYDRSAVWLDDEHIVYSSMMTGNATLFRQRADGSGSPEQLTSASRGAQFPLSLAPDGKSVVFERSGDPITSNDLMMLHLDRPVSASPTAASLASRDIGRTASLRETQPLVNDPAEQADGVISPDGRWLAYQSDESGIVEIYVRPFPDMKSGARHTVSSDTGAQPRWSSDGRELFFVSVRTNAMMSVRVHAGATWSAEPPQKLFDASVYTVRAPFPWLNYDVAKDGRFLMIKPLGRSAANGEGSASLVVVANWFEELKRLVPAK